MNLSVALCRCIDMLALWMELGYWYGVLRHFLQSFSYIVAVLLVEEIEVPEANHQPAVSH